MEQISLGGLWGDMDILGFILGLIVFTYILHKGYQPLKRSLHDYLMVEERRKLRKLMNKELDESLSK